MMGSNRRPIQRGAPRPMHRLAQQPGRRPPGTRFPRYDKSKYIPVPESFLGDLDRD